MPARPVRGAWRAAAAAAVAIVGAVGVAVGPAHADRADVTWPALDAPAQPDTTAQPGAPAQPDTPAQPGATDTSGEPHFTPLLLSAHSPQSLRALIPCRVVARSTGSTVLFATTRRKSVEGRLVIESEGASLRVRVSDEVLFATEAVDDAASCGFAFAVRARGFGAADWSLERDDVEVARGATVAPVMSGFASSSDPRGSGIVVSITTRASSSHPSARQWVLIVIALVAATAAVARLPGARGARDVRARATRDDRVARVVRWLDPIVIGVLGSWWLLGPWFFDDGWLMATVRARDGSGSFSNYFDTLAAQLPLGFAHHVLLWPFAATDAPFLLWRTVPLAAGVATWLIMRRVFLRVAPAVAPVPGLIVLAAAHLTFSFAWLITLRPEPIVALLSAAVMAYVIRYRDDAGPRDLAFALVGAALAMTLHPSGVVAAAPLILATPTMWRSVRAGRAGRVECATAFAIAAAIGIVTLFADTDIARWRLDRGLFAGDGFHSKGVLDELDRYRDLLANGSIPALASVLVAGVALLAWTIAALERPRPTGTRGAPLAFGAALVVAVGLLALTPSKWIYHFGSVSAMAALAIATEASRASLPERDRRTRLVGIGIVVLLAFVGARSLRHPRDAQYFLELGSRSPEVFGNPLLWVVPPVAFLAHPRGREHLRGWSFAVVLGAVVVVTLVVSVAIPAVEGPRWAMPRAGVDDLVHGGCPIADAIEVSDLRLSRALERVDDRGPGQASFSLEGTEGADIVATVRASPGATGVTLRVAWVHRDGDARGFTRAATIAVPPFNASVYGPAPTTRLVRIGTPRARARGENEVRLTVRAGADGSPASVTDVVAVVPRSLSSVVVGKVVLVSPPELPLLRCTRPPIVHDGIAAMPDVVIGFERRTGVDEIAELGSPSGPWFLAEDAYETTRVWGWLSDTDAFAVTLRDASGIEQVVPISIVER